MPVSRTGLCLFCSLASHHTEAAIVYEDPTVLAVMDLYPATKGHAMVFPKRHVEDIYSMPEDLASRIMAIAIDVAKSIRLAMSPDGLNLVQANGSAAGQTNRHFHLHVIPRYHGDRVNLRFGRTALPESLENLRKTAALVRAEMERKV